MSMPQPPGPENPQPGAQPQHHTPGMPPAYNQAPGAQQPQGAQYAPPQQQAPFPQAAPGQPAQFEQQPPAPKAKKPFFKRVWFWVLVVIAVLVAANLGNGGDNPGTTADEPTTAQASEEAVADDAADDAEGAATGAEDVVAEDEAEITAGIGDTVTIDDWSVVVTGVDAPVASVGNDFLNTEAQGEFIPVHITVTNEGKQAEYFFADNFVLVDDQGREFSYSTDATIYGAADGAVSLLDEINPGNTIEGVLYYDAPVGTNIVEMKVSGGLFTAPVTIALQ